METILYTVRKITLTETAKLSIFAGILLCLPLFLSGPQLLVGSIVNLLLIWATWELSWPKVLFLAFLPSIGALLNGVIFGPFTIFLVYMMPAIWIGNILLMFVIKYISKKRLGIIIGGVSKSIFLFLVAFVLFKLGMLPKIFLTAMGVFQFITVMIGGGASFLFRKILRVKLRDNHL